MSRYNLRLEYVADNGDVVRSECWCTEEQARSNNGSALLDGLQQLRYKVDKALKEDGYIPAPSNVVPVDFVRKVRL